MSVLALPSYAATTEQMRQLEFGQAQAFTTNSGVDIAVPGHLPSAEEQPVVIAVQAAAAASYSRSAYVADVPAGVGASGLVNAALAQLGVYQDCTDLVQNSLAAIGLETRRDQGGYDHSTSSFQRFGWQVTNGEWAPGDILGWPGHPHVALYIGDGLAVHGGMGGTTIVTSATQYFGTPSYVVRVA